MDVTYTAVAYQRHEGDTSRRRQMGGIYEVYRCHDVHTKFHKAWLRR
jgi:hypothetical protein